MNPGDHPKVLHLWLLRHAKAAAEPPLGASDHDRLLAPRGRRDAVALGRRIRDLGFGSVPAPQLVLASTAARTTETARLVTDAIEAPVEVRHRLYYGSPDDVLDEARTVDEGVRSLMVVGHNPATHSLALGLLGDDDGDHGRAALASYPTCALCVLALPVSGWRQVTMASASLVGFVVPPYTA